MSIDVVFDNDIILKGAYYRLAHEFVNEYSKRSNVGILQAARFVVRNRIEKSRKVVNRHRATVEFENFLGLAESLEPSDLEVMLAAEIEEAAQAEALEVDTGESQLLAMVIYRGIPLVVTGDKHAICGVQTLLEIKGELLTLKNKIVCLEQAILAVMERMGTAEMCSRVCAEPHADKAISMCFSCSSGVVAEHAAAVYGLQSYISHLRGLASDVLVNN